MKRETNRSGVRGPEEIVWDAVGRRELLGIMNHSWRRWLIITDDGGRLSSIGEPECER
jgi:hypothetical protein